MRIRHTVSVASDENYEFECVHCGASARVRIVSEVTGIASRGALTGHKAARHAAADLGRGLGFSLGLGCGLGRGLGRGRGRGVGLGRGLSLGRGFGFGFGFGRGLSLSLGLGFGPPTGNSRDGTPLNFLNFR